MTEHKIITDPRIIGSVLWNQIHLKAIKAVDEKSKQHFIDHMWFLAETFPCLNCRKHLNEYLRTHPFDHFYKLQDKNGVDIGMFKWSWIFHNAVNTRLGKPYLDWKTAWEMYDIESIVPCTDCGSEPIISKPDTNKIIQGYFLRKGINENISRLS